MTAVAAVIEDGGRVLVARRKPFGRFGGLWEFPGGKVEAGEKPEDALGREILEELGLRIEVGASYGAFPYRSDDTAFDLLAFRAVIRSGTVTLTDHDRALWVRPDELDPSGFAPADVPLVLILKGKDRLP
jgi:8-oxo-dGTP diphosphatase